MTPFKKMRDAIINKDHRKPTMRNKRDTFKDNEHYGKVKKARSKYEEKLEPEDIDNIPGIEILKEKKDVKRNN